MASSQKLSNKTIFLLFLLFLTTIFNLVSAQHSHGKETKECRCLKNDHDHDHDHEEESNNGSTIKYKVGAIVAILCASAFGVFLPILGKNIPGLRPDKSTFVTVKTFAAGVILCTALIHILPEAFENLTNPCIGEDSVVLSFPFTGVAVMVGALLTLIMDCLATRHFSGANNGGNGDEEDKDGDVHHHVHGSASHAPIPTGLSRVEIIRYRVTSQVLEMGIVVHSVIIGIALGTSQEVDTIKPLMAALCFHQFFEGVGLGGCIVQASFKSASMMCMALFFSLTTPVGIAIGIGITNVYDESSPTALIVQGLLDAVAAGILIYMALVDLLAQDFMNPKVHNNNRLFFWANVALLLGAGFMAVLAIWA